VWASTPLMAGVLRVAMQANQGTQGSLSMARFYDVLPAERVQRSFPLVCNGDDFQEALS